MSSVRKRRATDADPSESRRQRPRSDSPSEMSESDVEHGAPSSLDAMVKKMVRLALASEYSRLPIRRTDISAKVLGEQGSRQFKTVFAAAQQVLRNKFGMEMVELPAREKVTITQRRAAQKTEKPSSSTKSWILTTTLPAAYRTPAIIPPTKAPSTNTESTLTALYSFIIAVISLNGGSLGEEKLMRYLRRMNADDYTPIDKTDKLLARLCREGYLVRTRENDNGEEIIEFMVGPRGKIEVGTSGVAGLVREVYGRGRGAGSSTENREDESTQIDREMRAEFEARLRQSLGIVGMGEQDEEEEQQQQQQQQEQAVNGRVAGESVRSTRQSEAPRRSSRRATTARESSSGESEMEDSVKDESEEESD